MTRLALAEELQISVSTFDRVLETMEIEKRRKSHTPDHTYSKDVLTDLRAIAKFVNYPSLLATDIYE